MPNIYMLNLLFDPTDSNETTNGNFIEYSGTQTSLNASKVWLEANVASPDPDNSSNWVVLNHDTSVLSLNVGDSVWMRTAGINNISGYSARFTVVVGRDESRATHGSNGKAEQKRASPFPLAQSQQSCCIYDTVNPTYQPQSSAGSWVIQVPPVQFKTTWPTNPPPPPNPHDSYAVVVALTLVTPTGGTITYSHDPNMDVDC